MSIKRRWYLLTADEDRCLKLRFGLPSRTEGEVARMMNIDVQMVRRLVASALAKLAD